MLTLATGFRCFFLLATLLAVMAVPVWTYLVTGHHQISSNLGAMGWHAHEMIFGYLSAVLAGFFLTAVRNWTKRPTLAGWPLGGLVLLWLLGRGVALQTAHLPAMAPVLIDGMFFAVLTYSMARPIIAARSWRNLGFCALVGLLGLCDIAIHLRVLRILPPSFARAFDLALDALVLIIVIFAGRVIPMFSQKGTGQRVRTKDVRDYAGIGAVLVLMISRALYPAAPWTWGIAIGAGLQNALRLVGWGGRHTWNKPILFVLHLGWFLMCAALVIPGVAGLLHISSPRAFLHLLTIGGLGVITFGMMARVSLGHTGRALLGSRSIGVGLAFLLVATATRVAAPLADPSHYALLLWIAGLCWSSAFLVFLARYGPILLAPRPDGKPG